MAKIDEFKEYVKLHPELKDEVVSKKKTWQNLFEEWDLFKTVEVEASTMSDKPITKEAKEVGDIIKTCINYVKKIDADNITKTVSNVQKLMALVAGFGAANTAKAANKTGDPLFDKGYDEWY